MTRQLVEVAVRLHDRFGADVTFAEVLTVVEGCRRDLDMATMAGLPELVERLATQRLLDARVRLGQHHTQDERSWSGVCERT
ncbi:hypothetical protein [Smaragdicoccus niigatensis]|uniref:hypothetical protein n=1 Tax=Smaragdicoccus niigatensis TaxID=359359 RepID=UPI0012DF4B0D|nr:hypothetical protein [Smaragdicoccus niigatensis]